MLATPATASAGAIKFGDLLNVHPRGSVAVNRARHPANRFPDAESGARWWQPVKTCDLVRSYVIAESRSFIQLTNANIMYA
jgi:hypothetical protein